MTIQALSFRPRAGGESVRDISGASQQKQSSAGCSWTDFNGSKKEK